MIKLGDNVKIGKYDCVVESMLNKYYLRTGQDSNNKIIFTQFNIKREDLEKLVNVNKQDSFPMCNTLEDLEILINYIKSKETLPEITIPVAKFNIGQIVKNNDKGWQYDESGINGPASTSHLSSKVINIKGKITKIEFSPLHNIWWYKIDDYGNMFTETAIELINEELLLIKDHYYQCLHKNTNCIWYFKFERIVNNDLFHNGSRSSSNSYWRNQVSIRWILNENSNFKEVTKKEAKGIKIELKEEISLKGRYLKVIDDEHVKHYPCIKGDYMLFNRSMNNYEYWGDQGLRSNYEGTNAHKNPMFELMHEGFNPKPEPIKIEEIVPVYEKCIAVYNEFRNCIIGRIYKKKEYILYYNNEYQFTCSHDSKARLEWFIPSTKEEYDAQFVEKDLIDDTGSENGYSGSKHEHFKLSTLEAFNLQESNVKLYLSDECGVLPRLNSDYINSWTKIPSRYSFGYMVGHDPYKKENKTKSIPLLEIKKRRII